MRKRIIATLVFVFFGVFILINSLISQSLADEIKIKIPISTVTVLEDNEGNAKYSGDNVQYLTQSGEPMLPYQVIKVLLPPDADLNTVSGKVDNAQVEELTGEWDVRPKPPETTWDGKNVITVWPKGKTIVNGYDINIYEKNALFPENLIGTIAVGQTRKWRMVDIPIALYQFNPVAKKLLHLVEGELTIKFSIDPAAISVLKEKIDIPDRIGEDSVKKLTVNFNEVSPTYEKLFPQALTPQQISRYVIITTNNIKSGSGELQNFVTSKVMRGFTVEVVTEDAWGGGTGDTAAENIRDWLSNNYENKNIEYVLLIGNLNPNSGDVPMKMFWPQSDATEYRESPSDYYYADLTGNWDLDGDGLYGERYGDFGPGGVDRNWDVLVGRIPYYGNMNDLDAILAKIIAYENETSNEADWRQNVLLPMKPSDPNTPGYHLGEAIKNDTITYKGNNWDYHRVYDEDFGLIPPPETYPCTYANVTDAWNSSKFGAIFWWTHGWSTGASSIMDLSHAATLDDNYPGFAFQASCYNSYPEVSDNLSYSLLKNGCIGTIGATRVSWYWPENTNFKNSTCNAGMAYEYSKRLIESELDSGHALYEMKQVLVPGIWMNFTVFNIYGDPSTGLFTFTEFKGLQNGDFEQGVADAVFYWTTDVWKPTESIMVWEPFGEGYQGSRSVSIEHTEENDSRWIQVVSGLLPGMEYRLSGWIKGQNIVNVTGTIGANLCLFGTWEHTPGISGTFDWTEVSMIFTAPPDGAVVIGCRLGYWGNTTTGKVWFDNISLTTPSSYTAVPPCRIVDTRNAGGMIGAWSGRNFHVYGPGGTISAQGGATAGCPAPMGEPRAAHINMVAVDPTGKGNLQAFPKGASPGAGLTVNYNTIDTNLANAGRVKTSFGAGTDITVYSAVSSAHTVIDVLGYYYSNGDLLYMPVTPCRIVDTRNAGGMIGAWSGRDFHVYGNGGTISAQGGTTNGCLAPLDNPLAAHINMVVVDPTGKGNLQAFPKGASPGSGMTVNYNAIDTNLANAGTVKTNSGAGTDITVYSGVSSTHTVIDVLGYYYPDGDLLYTPVTPCRIVDTRNAGGLIGPSSGRNFYVYGTPANISAQGGNAAGCPAPMGEPLAAHINMVAVDPTGKGNLQAFPKGVGPGSGMTVNYNAIDTNLANAGSVKTSFNTGTDITVYSGVSSAHTVIDVLGYYYPAP